MNGIVFCTTCKNRTTHLRETLPKNMTDNPDSLFIVLDYNSNDDLRQYLKQTFSTEINSGKLIVYSYFDWPKYRFAHSKNLAHRLGMKEGGKILVNLDADNYAGQFEKFVHDAFKDNQKIFLWSQMIKGELVRGINGRIGVSRGAFLNVGGYDEDKFTDWGSDDKDFHLRLMVAGYEGVEIDKGYLQAIRHNDKIRFKEFPNLMNIVDGSNEYEERVVNRWTASRALVNNGNVGCGKVFRNFELDDVVMMEPIPTRVFGVGWHKTATTSLHNGFEILGYHGWHWSSAHVAKAIWREMNNEGRSKTVEQYYALSDLPIPLLYKQLDKAYPGSKFILTVRNEDQWLDSVKRHFDPVYNKHQLGWDSDPFTNRLHQLCYGRKDFDAEVFLSRYRRHNAEVLEYFKHRPDTLLVMKTETMDWPQICSFLGEREPEVPFPRSYVDSQNVRN